MNARSYLAAVALCAAPALAAPVPVAPAAQALTLGAFHLHALRDELNAVPNDGSVFGLDAGVPAVTAVLQQAGAPTDTLTLGVDALLVATPGHVVLIDTGLGPKAGGVLMQSLAEAGVKPGAVTDILITHSHPDHIGGLLTAAGTLAFPKAVIRMSAPEWAFLRGKPGAAQTVAAIAPRVRPFKPGAPVLPGIVSLALGGHTPGHVGYRITSQGRSLTDIGDTAHSAIVSLAKPGWTIGYDTDAAAGRATRETELAHLAAGHDLLFSPHFPFPGLGRIETRGTGYAWVPVKD